MRRPELTPARSRSRRAHHTDATHRRLIGGSRLSSFGAVAVVEVSPGKWRARTRFRFDDGRLRQVERFAPSRAKAEAKLKHALTTIQNSTAVEVKRETRLSDLGERFLVSKANRAPKTVESYTHSVRKVVVPRIGELAVSEATPERLQRFIDLVVRENGPGAAKTARAVLSGMLGLATRSDAVRSNPVRELASIEVKPMGALAIPVADLPGLLERVRGDQRLNELDMVDLVEFVAGTGVRISEAIGLEWRDVDWKARTVTIRASKTDAGDRTIRVPQRVMAMLEGRRGDNKLSPALDPVFPTPLGKRRGSRNTAREWAEARSRLGLNDRYTFHAFRKTVATALDQAGLTARDVAEYLGHANPALTQSVYMSKLVGGTRAADALDAVMQN